MLAGGLLHGHLARDGDELHPRGLVQRARGKSRRKIRQLVARSLQLALRARLDDLGIDIDIGVFLFLDFPDEMISFGRVTGDLAAGC